MSVACPPSLAVGRIGQAGADVLNRRIWKVGQDLLDGQPEARHSKTSCTVIRRPRMQALPLRLPGSIVMMSLIAHGAKLGGGRHRVNRQFVFLPVIPKQPRHLVGEHLAAGITADQLGAFLHVTRSAI